MLDHLNDERRKPDRVVIVGAAGFVGSALRKRLEEDGIGVLALTRKEVDLLAHDAALRLADHLRPSDSFVAVAAIAPCKNAGMLKDNISLVEALAAALEKQPVSHVVNIGSDAIYADSDAPLSEGSCAAPCSVHGVMHLAREIILQEAAADLPFATLRPTLIYGHDDPHNGYGPNRFRRLAARGEKIVLFGEGEERRDHVLIDDVAEIAARALIYRSTGALNIATGTVASFREIANSVISHFDEPVQISGSPRRGPMPHNGYRAFDPAATHAAFPDFRYTQLTDGLARVHNEAAARA